MIISSPLLRSCALAICASATMGAVVSPAAAANPRVTFGSLFEESADGDCVGSTCTVKFSLLNAAVMVTQVSCHLVYAYDSGPTVVLWKLTESPETTVEFLNNQTFPVGQNNQMSIYFNEDVEHLVVKGAKPSVQVTLSGAPTSGAVGCTIAGTTTAPTTAP